MRVRWHRGRGSIRGCLCESVPAHARLAQGAAIEDEHCNVGTGFGASDVAMFTENYNIRFTPREEYRFVVDDEFVTPMSAGTDRASGESLGFREKISVKALMREAVPRLREAFAALGWSASAVTPKLFAELRITEEEIVTLRLYTGPCFMIYNTVLRAMATPRQTAAAPADKATSGASVAPTPVAGRFVTTIHATNSGVIKLSRLQPACEVYRGVRGMKLPRTFVTANEHNVRGGVENSFLSATTDMHEALKYARGKDDEQGPGILAHAWTTFHVEHARSNV